MNPVNFTLAQTKKLAKQASQYRSLVRSKQTESQEGRIRAERSREELSGRREKGEKQTEIGYRKNSGGGSVKRAGTLHIQLEEGDEEQGETQKCKQNMTERQL